MKSELVATLVSLFFCAALPAQTFNYKGETITPGPHTFYVDGSLTDAQAANSPYVFNNFNDAIAHVTDGTVSDPMKVYIAPWVYWIGDPDDPQVRKGQGGSAPVGLTVRCESLQLLGICTDARDVVLASNRGQTQGAIGNFTMFDFYGDNLVVKDLTMGNYCNIDLEYPRNPALGRQKRNSAITQAQVAFCHGDRIFAENVRFMARLNLCPLVGARRILFLGCHFESTDDSLTPTGVYLNCDLDFWGRQPFGGVDRYGTVFMNSDFNIRHTEAVQALSKNVGRHSIVDCRYHSGREVSLSWTFRPEDWLRCYQYDISLDGQPTFVGAAKPYNTVILDQKAQLGAYRLVEDDGTVLYNTYNLLRGDDDWDPQGIKEKVAAIGRRDGRDYADIATCLDMNVHEASIQTGGTPLELSASLMRHVGYKLDNQEVSWRVQPGFERFVTLSNTSGPSCTVTSANHGDKTQTFDIIASTADGLEGAVQVTAAPDFLEPPAFPASPKMTIASGRATVDYSLDLQGREDESLITWYRCDDKRGDGAVPVGVSRFDKPKKTYTTGRDDVGHYIMAGVSPKHLRSNPGREVRVVSKTPVRKSQAAAAMSYSSDFSDFPAENQLVIRPGYWTVDAFKPEDTSEYDWKVDTSKPCWAYGSGINGARGYGLQQLQQGARLLYTPLTGSYNGMKVTWQVDPAKDGGQGFASARMQYLDLFINFDTSTLTGYALRAIRTTKYANAVDILLVRYDHGHVKAISDSITTDCFLTGCQLTVETSGDRISAHVEGPGRIAGLAGDKAVHHTVDITARYVPEGFGGFGLQHTSTVGTESRILIHSVSAVWK